MPPISNYIKSEEDVSTKIVLPFLHACGYSSKNIFSNVNMLDILAGRKNRPIRADFVIKITNTAAIIIEVKKKEETLEQALEQGKSYAHHINKNKEYENVQYVPFVLAIDQYSLSVLESKTNVLWTARGTFEVEALFTNDLTIDDKSHLFQELSKIVSYESVVFWLKKAGKTPFQEEVIQLKPITDRNWNEIRTTFDKCHNLIRNRYANHPTAAFHEMSKILFIKMNEEYEMQKYKGKPNRFNVSALIDSKKKFNQDLIAQLFEEVKLAYADEELFEQEDRITLRFGHVRSIVGWLQNYQFVDNSMSSDIAGKVFENFVGATLRGKGLGQFFTPREVIEFMVEMVNPKIGEKILDPASGSGGFLLHSFNHVRKLIRHSGMGDEEQKRLCFNLVNENLFGVELNEDIARTCKMNMIVHGDGRNSVYVKRDGLLDIINDAIRIEKDNKMVSKEIREYNPEIPNTGFQVILTNPPFGGSLEVGDTVEFDDEEISGDAQETKNKSTSKTEIEDPDILKKFTVGKGKKRVKTEKLFIERCIRLLAPNGRLGIIVPDGILNDDLNQDIRDFIKQETNIKAIISLPDVTFKPSGTSIKTNILYLEKKNKTNNKQKNIFMAIPEHVGFKGGPKRIRPDSNDLMEVVLPKWQKWYEENG